MESTRKFIENKLKLKVNKDKSAVDRPGNRKFLGFSFYNNKDGVGICVHEKSLKRIRYKLKLETGRSRGVSVQSRLNKIRMLTIGWINYFGIADIKRKCSETDKWLRRRIRMCI